MSKFDIIIRQGKTFERVVRWESGPIVYKSISKISQTAPVKIEASGHNLVDGWRVAIVSARGMSQINAKNNPPAEYEYYQVSVVDQDNIEINSLNSSDYSPYTSGGYLQYNTPVPLDNYTARMTIKDKIGGTELFSLTSSNGGIVLDPVAHTVKLFISAADTESFTWTSGVYDLEMVSPLGVVSELLSGRISNNLEVTT